MTWFVSSKDGTKFLQDSGCLRNEYGFGPGVFGSLETAYHFRSRRDAIQACTGLLGDGRGSFPVRADKAKTNTEEERLLGIIMEMEGLIEYSSKWLNDSTLWESDDHLAPMWQDIRNRAYKNLRK